MASFTKRGDRWRVQVRRKGCPSQCRTFATKAQGERWARQVETDIEGGAPPAAVSALKVDDFIEAYRRLREQARPISDASNEHYMLKALSKGLGAKVVARMAPDDLVAYATMRREEGAGPYTINMDISKLGTVLRYGGASLRVTPPDVVGAARPLLDHLRLIGSGGKRERRPTDDELRAVIQHLRAKHGDLYALAVTFAAVSAMRRGEVCAIKGEDIDREQRIVQVMRKHPRKGKVLERVPLLGEAWEIVKARPENGRLFPIDPATLSKYFCWACRALGIPDLKLHDLRHEGTSRLFEAGYDIPEVALVTGHKKWEQLKRYTNLRPEALTQPEVERDRSAQPRRGSRQSASRPQGTSSPGKSRR